MAKHLGSSAESNRREVWRVVGGASGLTLLAILGAACSSDHHVFLPTHHNSHVVGAVAAKSKAGLTLSACPDVTHMQKTTYPGDLWKSEHMANVVDALATGPASCRVVLPPESTAHDCAGPSESFIGSAAIGAIITKTEDTGAAGDFTECDWGVLAIITR